MIVFSTGGIFFTGIRYVEMDSIYSWIFRLSSPSYYSSCPQSSSNNGFLKLKSRRSANMNVTGEYSMESRQRFVKQQLSALGYDPKFSIDTLPLLENLVSDLLQTTDTLQHYKSLWSTYNCLQACYNLEQFLDAYKKDNTRLVQELNTLHLNTLSKKFSTKNV